MSLKLYQSSPVYSPSINKAGAKLHLVWVKKIDASQREYLAAVWTTQD
jgi:hypothetical protein